MTSDIIDTSTLPRTASLTLYQIIALYIGSVLGSGILILPGLTADLAGPAALVAWFLMSILSIPMALTMGLLSIRLPNAGGVSHFVSTAFSPALGSLTGYFFFFSSIVAVPIMAITGAGYACQAFGLDTTIGMGITLLIIGVAICSNYLGMHMTGQLQLAVVCATIGILAGAILGSVQNISLVNFTPFLPHGWISVGQAMTLIFWCFLGWEAVSHVTEEFEDPKRDICRATIIASTIISSIYLATIIAVIGTRSYGEGISEVSLIHLIGIATGTHGLYLAGFITLFITIAPSIAYTGAACRLAFFLSKSGSAPGCLGRTSSRYHTPVGGLVFLSGCFLLILAIYWMDLISMALLIQIPNATFILTYIGGCAAGLVLFKEEVLGRAVSVISLLVSFIVLCFAGWAMIWPLLIFGIWAGYRMITIRHIRAYLAKK